MSQLFSTILALSSFATAADPADWKPVSPADGAFSAELPAEPKVLDREVGGPKGPIRQVTHYCKVAGALYSIQSLATSTPGPLSARKSQARLEREAYLKSDGGKLIKQEDVLADEQPGWEITLKGSTPGGGGGTVTSRVRMLVAEKATYTITVMSAKDRPLPDETGRFFDSFHLAGSAKPRAEAVAKPGGSPEEVLRAFFLAMIFNDEAKVRALALPADGLELLWKGVAPPPEAADQIKKQVSAQPIKVLKPGDEFTLPGNRKMTVPAEDVTDDRAVLLPEGAPTPTRLRKVDGEWKVDARPLIAARKGAAAARAKAKAGK